jgi:hypothetical protein
VHSYGIFTVYKEVSPSKHHYGILETLPKHSIVVRAALPEKDSSPRVINFGLFIEDTKTF